MSHALEPQSTPDTSALSDRAVSVLRTAVPALWGSLVAALLRILAPHLPVEVYAALADVLSGPLAQALVVALAIAAWYWAWRRLEPLIPEWLTRFVLGSARTPSYAPVVSAAGITTLDGCADTGTLAPSDLLFVIGDRVRVTPADTIHRDRVGTVTARHYAEAAGAQTSYEVALDSGGMGLYVVDELERAPVTKPPGLGD